MTESWRDIEGPKLLTLVLSHRGLIVCVRDLEPRARRSEIQMERIFAGRLQVDGIEKILSITATVNGQKLGRVEESSRFKTVNSYEVPDSASTKTERRSPSLCAKRSVSASHATLQLGQPQA